MGMTSVHLRVLRGWYCRVFVERQMVEVDFTLHPLGPQMASAWFLERVLQRDAVDRMMCDVPLGEVDHMLAALGLYRMLVRCVIPEELGGEYKHEVSVGVVMCIGY